MNNESEPLRNEFEQLLRSFTPAPPCTSQEIVLYEAGFAAGRNQVQTPVSTPLSVNRFSFGLAAGIAATLLTMFALQKTHIETPLIPLSSSTIVQSQSPISVDSAPTTNSKVEKSLERNGFAWDNFKGKAIGLPYWSTKFLNDLQSVFTPDDNQSKYARPIDESDLRTNRSEYLIGLLGSNFLERQSSILTSQSSHDVDVPSEPTTSSSIPHVYSFPLRDKLLQEPLF